MLRQNIIMIFITVEIVGEYYGRQRRRNNLQTRTEWSGKEVECVYWSLMSNDKYTGWGGLKST